MQYLALGDSMSIDKYTDVEGGGAVSQFHRWLGDTWHLLDKTLDGCTVELVDTSTTGELITLTIGGNDALQHMDRVMTDGTDLLVARHRELLERLRAQNPDACLIVGNVYAPQSPLPPALERQLSNLNSGIAKNIGSVGGRLADIHETFRGHEADYLCLDIEPTHQGASAIAGLFQAAYSDWISIR